MTTAFISTVSNRRSDGAAPWWVVRARQGCPLFSEPSQRVAHWTTQPTQHHQVASNPLPPTARPPPGTHTHSWGGVSVVGHAAYRDVFVAIEVRRVPRRKKSGDGGMGGGGQSGGGDHGGEHGEPVEVERHIAMRAALGHIRGEWRGDGVDGVNGGNGGAGRTNNNKFASSFDQWCNLVSRRPCDDPSGQRRAARQPKGVAEQRQTPATATTGAVDRHGRFHGIPMPGKPGGGFSFGSSAAAGKTGTKAKPSLIGSVNALSGRYEFFCAHGPVIIRSAHWSCCGKTRLYSRCSAGVSASNTLLPSLADLNDTAIQCAATESSSTGTCCLVLATGNSGNSGNNGDSGDTARGEGGQRGVGGGRGRRMRLWAPRRRNLGRRDELYDSDDDDISAARIGLSDDEDGGSHWGKTGGVGDDYEGDGVGGVGSDGDDDVMACGVACVDASSRLLFTGDGRILPLDVQTVCVDLVDADRDDDGGRRRRRGRRRRHPGSGLDDDDDDRDNSALTVRLALPTAWTDFESEVKRLMGGRTVVRATVESDNRDGARRNGMMGAWAGVSSILTEDTYAMAARQVR